MKCPDNRDKDIQANCEHPELAYSVSYWYDFLQGVKCYTCRCSNKDCNTYCQCKQEMKEDVDGLPTGR